LLAVLPPTELADQKPTTSASPDPESLEDTGSSVFRVSDPPQLFIRACLWNIKKLGFENRVSLRDYALMAVFIKANCDLTGIVEVMALVGGVNQPGYQALANEMGITWGHAINNRALPGHLGPNDEKYAFFWDTAKIRQCDGFGVRTFPDAQDRFVREPAVACFEAPPQSHGMDFLLALHHAPSPSVKEPGRSDSELIRRNHLDAATTGA
jgi:hypothetical protein